MVSNLVVHHFDIQYFLINHIVDDPDHRSYQYHTCTITYQIIIVSKLQRSVLESNYFLIRQIKQVRYLGNSRLYYQRRSRELSMGSVQLVKGILCREKIFYLCPIQVFFDKGGEMYGHSLDPSPGYCVSNNFVVHTCDL